MDATTDTDWDFVYISYEPKGSGVEGNTNFVNIENCLLELMVCVDLCCMTDKTNTDCKYDKEDRPYSNTLTLATHCIKHNLS